MCQDPGFWAPHPKGRVPPLPVPKPAFFICFCKGWVCWEALSPRSLEMLQGCSPFQSTRDMLQGSSPYQST